LDAGSSPNVFVDFSDELILNAVYTCIIMVLVWKPLHHYHFPVYLEPFDAFNTFL